MEEIELKLRLLDIAARVYGGASSLHINADGVANIASNWYNGIESWKKPDTVAPSSTLKLPKK